MRMQSATRSPIVPARHAAFGLLLAAGLALPLAATAPALAAIRRDEPTKEPAKEPAKEPTPAPAAPVPQPAPAPSASPTPPPAPAAVTPVTPVQPTPITGPDGAAPAAMPPATPPVAPPPADAAPGGAHDDKPHAKPQAKPQPPGTYRFPAFAEPVDVKLLVDMVAERLDIQVISTDQALRDKQVQLLTPVDVPKEKLLEFLGYLLEQNGQYITREPTGVYIIRPSSEFSGAVGGELATIQVIPTKGIRPSSLTTVINSALRGGTAALNPAQGGGAGGNAGSSISFADELGVIVMADTPRRIQTVRELVDTVAAEQIAMDFTRFEVRHLAAATARNRMLELLGSSGTRSAFFNPNDPNQQAQAQAAAQQGAGGTGPTSNLALRLIPEAQSNALLLKGRPEEIELIQRLLAIVDVPNQLIPKWYPVGSASTALAEQGQRAGLGEVNQMQSTRGDAALQGQIPGQPFNVAVLGQRQNQTSVGPNFVLDSEGRGFIYYGTAEQHAQLEKLVREFSDLTQAERVVYEFYKLKFADAEATAEVIRNMISNTVSQSGNSPLVPGVGGATGAGNRNRRGAQLNQEVEQAGLIAVEPMTTSTGVSAITASEDVHVLADIPNNQVVVKAPQRLQPQFERIIGRLDQRRSQVYIDAKIVVVTDNEEFRLAFETQLINAGGTGGAFRTSFVPGSSSLGTTNQGILTPPTVNPLSGITAAIIKSDQVPIIINALASSTETRLVASPQLLVDDNEEAELSSIEERPTQTTTVGSGTGTSGTRDVTSFGGYQEAGPRLTVKPRISSGDLLSMEYRIELSSFDDTRSVAEGLPPPRQTNTFESKSITVPSDSTIVVGGLAFEEKGETVVRVPLLGDIPILGELFKSRGNNDRRRMVYVFMTPRIMRDPFGNDLRLFSKGPMADVKLNETLPAVKPEFIEIIPSAPVPATREPMRKEETAPADMPTDPSPQGGR